MSLWFVDMNQRVKNPGSPWWSAWAWAASAIGALSPQYPGGPNPRARSSLYPSLTCAFRTLKSCKGRAASHPGFALRRIGSVSTSVSDFTIAAVRAL